MEKCVLTCRLTGGTGSNRIGGSVVLGVKGTLENLLGANKTDHPLADPKELKRAVSELPVDNAFRALDEAAGWLESLLATHDFPLDRFFEAVRQLDEAAQAHVRRLTRDYLNSPRLSKSEENRLWTMLHGFWSLVAGNYEKCLVLAGEKNRVAEAFKPQHPLLLTRVLAAVAALRKWQQFRYGPVDPVIWQRLGRAYSMAELLGVAGKPVQLYPATPGMTTPTAEYLKALVFQASSMDSLLPYEIELAERLLAHFLPGFIFGPEDRHDSVYWVDLLKAQPPMRLARMPSAGAPTLRFFQPGTAYAGMETLRKTLQQGGELPGDLNLGGQYTVKTVLPVIRHLATYWAPVPPQRKHDRHRVKHRMTALGGFINTLVAFSGEFGGSVVGLPLESWVVDNVSRGGFGAILNEIRGEWLKVGALVSLQPEGGNNWLVGAVRRYHRDTPTTATVGIESLARQAVAVELKPRTASSYASANSVPALWLMDGNEAGEVRMILPAATFDLRESMELVKDGRRLLFTPVALVEQTPEYELARYRARVAES